MDIGREKFLLDAKKEKKTSLFCFCFHVLSLLDHLSMKNITWKDPGVNGDMFIYST
jgi:hypothetical protein